MIYLSKPIIESEEINSVKKVLQSGRLAQGPIVEQLEESFSKLCGTKFSVATNSGTSALHTALHVLGIGKDDEVITTPFTFVATANSILMVGAKPVFVDIDPEAFNINPKLIEKKITKKTKAILAVDLFGQPANYEEINKIAKKYSLLVVEDAAQSIGATYNGKKSGNLGDIGCFSLYATKNIISGEGGMITMNDESLDKKARLFRSHGQNEKDRYNYLDLGYNYRMTDISAAIAVGQLKRINVLTRRRQEIAKIYDETLSGIKGLITPNIKENTISAYHQYTLRITEEFGMGRNELMKYLEGKGIQTGIYYPSPLYKFKHLSLDNNPTSFPVSERVSREVLSIPVHPMLTSEEIYYIINTIKKL